MSPLTSLIARRAIALVVAAAAFNFIADRASATGLETCPAKASEVAGNAVASLWIEHGRLMSCTTIGGRDPQTRQLGSWKSQGHLDLDGGTAIWTQRVKRSGHYIDLVYAADLSSTARKPLFVRAALPTSGAKKGSAARIAQVRAQGPGVAWVSRSHVLSAAVPSATTFAARLGDVAERGQGLYERPLRPSKNHFQLGSFLGTSVDELLGSLRIAQVGGEGCDATIEITVEQAGAPVGIEVGSRLAPAAC